MNATSIPAGFEPLAPSSPFVSVMGTFYAKAGQDGATILALRVSEHHKNVHGNAHGGMLATVADSALGYNLSRMTGQGVVTAQMNIEFLSAVHDGDWLEAHVTIEKKGTRLVFAGCELRVGDRRVLKTSAIFAVRRSDGASSHSDG